MNDRKIVSIYFGVPGSGKSTFAASIAHHCIKHKYPVFSNFPISGAYQYNVSMLGQVQFEDCKILIDEAGLEFNNRNFKSLSKENLNFFKLHRHYGCSIDVFSQTYDDMDKKLRDVAQILYLVRRSRIPGFVSAVPIRKRITINEDTHEIVDGYFFDDRIIRIFTTKRIWMRKYWKYFDSYSAPQLQKLEKRKW